MAMMGTRDCTVLSKRMYYSAGESSCQTSPPSVSESLSQNLSPAALPPAVFTPMSLLVSPRSPSGDLLPYHNSSATSPLVSMNNMTPPLLQDPLSAKCGSEHLSQPVRRDRLTESNLMSLPLTLYPFGESLKMDESVKLELMKYMRMSPSRTGFMHSSCVSLPPSLLPPYNSSISDTMVSASSPESVSIAALAAPPAGVSAANPQSFFNIGNFLSSENYNVGSHNPTGTMPPSNTILRLTNDLSISANAFIKYEQRKHQLGGARMTSLDANIRDLVKFENSFELMNRSPFSHSIGSNSSPSVSGSPGSVPLGHRGGDVENVSGNFSLAQISLMPCEGSSSVPMSSTDNLSTCPSSSSLSTPVPLSAAAAFGGVRSLGDVIDESSNSCNNENIKLGKWGRDRLKAALRDSFVLSPELRQKCNQITQVRFATISQLMRMAQVCGITDYAVDIAKAYASGHVIDFPPLSAYHETTKENRKRGRPKGSKNSARKFLRRMFSTSVPLASHVTRFNVAPHYSLGPFLAGASGNPANPHNRYSGTSLPFTHSLPTNSGIPWSSPAGGPTHPGLWFGDYPPAASSQFLPPSVTSMTSPTTNHPFPDFHVRGSMSQTAPSSSLTKQEQVEAAEDDEVRIDVIAQQSHEHHPIRMCQSEAAGSSAAASGTSPPGIVNFSDLAIRSVNSSTKLSSSSPSTTPIVSSHNPTPSGSTKRPRLTSSDIDVINSSKTFFTGFGMMDFSPRASVSASVSSDRSESEIVCNDNLKHLPSIATCTSSIDVVPHFPSSLSPVSASSNSLCCHLLSTPSPSSSPVSSGNSVSSTLASNHAETPELSAMSCSGRKTALPNMQHLSLTRHVDHAPRPLLFATTGVLSPTPPKLDRRSNFNALQTQEPQLQGTLMDSSSAGGFCSPQLAPIESEPSRDGLFLLPSHLPMETYPYAAHAYSMLANVPANAAFHLGSVTPSARLQSGTLSRRSDTSSLPPVPPAALAVSSLIHFPSSTSSSSQTSTLETGMPQFSADSASRFNNHIVMQCASSGISPSKPFLPAFSTLPIYWCSAPNQQLFA